MWQNWKETFGSFKDCQKTLKNCFDSKEYSNKRVAESNLENHENAIEMIVTPTVSNCEQGMEGNEKTRIRHYDENFETNNKQYKIQTVTDCGQIGGKNKTFITEEQKTNPENETNEISISIDCHQHL